MLGPGLSPEQGPPIAVPARFFLSAPLFLVLAGLIAALSSAWTASPLAAATLALSHLITLGFLGMAMLGAVSQMLPVVAGAPLPAVRLVAQISHVTLLLGTPLLARGLWDAAPVWILAGAALLACGLTPFIGATTWALLHARAGDTTQAMRLALIALLITLILGCGLAAWLAGHWQPAAPMHWLSAHVLWGLVGWIGLLVMGSAWQVVPMLQLTPPYPPRLTPWLWRGMLVALPLATLAAPPWQIAGHALAVLLLVVFALATLRLQAQRKRKLADTTRDYWRLAMASLIVASVLALAHALVDLGESWLLLAGLLFLAGFAISLVIGMLYKILPFLAWFHLQAARGFKPGQPSMRDYLPEAAARGQYRLHLAALACLLGAPFQPLLSHPGGLLLAASASWLGWNLLRAWRLYRRALAAG